MAVYSCGYIDPFFLNHSVYMAPIGVICIAIGIFLDYVIITQSKQLGIFKYYILNQAIWAQLYEFVLILTSPIVFNNCLGAVLPGFLVRSVGSYELTQILAIVDISLLCHTFLAVILCMVNRFLFVFSPSKRVYMDNKYTITCIVLFIIGNDFLFCGAIYSASADMETSKSLAINETGDSLVKYFDEPSFYYAGENGGKTRTFAKAMFSLMVFALLPFATCIIVFIFDVANWKKMNTKNRTARSLVLVVLVQAVLCVCMLMFPTIYIFASWAWNIEHTVDLTSYVTTILSFHGIADALCTIYCVKPYRRYVVKIFTRKKNVGISRTTS